MTKKELKKRLRVVKKSIRNAKGIDYITLSEELDTIMFLLIKGVD